MNKHKETVTWQTGARGERVFVPCDCTNAIFACTFDFVIKQTLYYLKICMSTKGSVIADCPPSADRQLQLKPCCTVPLITVTAALCQTTIFLWFNWNYQRFQKTCSQKSLTESDNRMPRLEWCKTLLERNFNFDYGYFIIISRYIAAFLMILSFVNQHGNKYLITSRFAANKFN